MYERSGQIKDKVTVKLNDLFTQEGRTQMFLSRA